MPEHYGQPQGGMSPAASPGAGAGAGAAQQPQPQGQGGEMQQMQQELMQMEHGELVDAAMQLLQMIRELQQQMGGPQGQPQAQPQPGGTGQSPQAQRPVR